MPNPLWEVFPITQVKSISPTIHQIGTKGPCKLNSLKQEGSLFIRPGGHMQSPPPLDVSLLMWEK